MLQHGKRAVKQVGIPFYLPQNGFNFGIGWAVEERFDCLGDARGGQLFLSAPLELFEAQPQNALNKKKIATSFAKQRFQAVGCRRDFGALAGGQRKCLPLILIQIMNPHQLGHLQKTSRGAVIAFVQV